MKEINFDDFWEYLSSRASDNDAWWLEGWLDDCLGEFNEATPCKKCGSRIKKKEHVWSKTRNHVLEYHNKCGKCNNIFGVIDNRKNIENLIEKGDVKAKDLPILREEVTPSNKGAADLPKSCAKCGGKETITWYCYECLETETSANR